MDHLALSNVALTAPPAPHHSLAGLTVFSLANYQCPHDLLAPKTFINEVLAHKPSLQLYQSPNAASTSLESQFLIKGPRIALPHKLSIQENSGGRSDTPNPSLTTPPCRCPNSRLSCSRKYHTIWPTESYRSSAAPNCDASTSTPSSCGPVSLSRSGAQCSDGCFQTRAMGAMVSSSSPVDSYTHNTG